MALPVNKVVYVPSNAKSCCCYDILMTGKTAQVVHVPFEPQREKTGLWDIRTGLT